MAAPDKLDRVQEEGEFPDMPGQKVDVVVKHVSLHVFLYVESIVTLFVILAWPASQNLFPLLNVLYLYIYILYL